MTEQLNQELELPSIFAACCGENYRFAREKPYVCDGKWCATDGHIGVRSTANTQLPDTDAKAPSMKDLEWDGPFDQPIELPDVADCMIACVCDAGTCQCETCKANHDCGKCGGLGKVFDGNVLAPFGLADDVAVPSARYVALLREHGVTHIRPPASSKNSPKVWAFKGEGFEGLLMPVRIDKK